ncbi:MAG: J domain-containing protein, partial [Chloroflexi bacterium]
MEYLDYYKVLGVAKGANEKEIKRAYRKLAREYHPDKNPDDKASEDKFKQINEAYEVLGNEDNRAKYDRLGSAYHQYANMGGAPSGFDFSQWMGGNGGGYQGNVDFGDIFGSGASSGGFSDFFSSIFANSGGGGFQRPSSFNLDIDEPVTITLEEAYQGASRAFTQNGRRFTAKIPAGARNGSKIRIRGKGRMGQGRMGDLFLVVSIAPHADLTRDNDNLKATIEVEDVTAVLGGRVAVPPITGPVNLTIPAGTQGGQTFRLKGKGMPNLQKKGTFGDLLATVKIRVPKQLTSEESELYEALAHLRGIAT